MTERSSGDVLSDAPRLAMEPQRPSACQPRQRLGALSVAVLCAILVGTWRIKSRTNTVAAADIRPIVALGSVAPARLPDAIARPLDALAPVATVAPALDQTDEVDLVVQRLSARVSAAAATSELNGNPFYSATQPSTDAGAAEPLHRREAERQQILAAVQQLRLGAILKGSAKRACLIDDALVQEGQEIDGFSVEEITPTVVVVRKGAYRFELRIGR